MRTSETARAHRFATYVEQLATVLGHEVAHASQHHGAERMSDAMALQTVAGAASSAVGEKYQAAASVAFGLGEKAGELGFSRTHESEADHVGLLYMARARCIRHSC